MSFPKLLQQSIWFNLLSELKHTLRINKLFDFYLTLEFNPNLEFLSQNCPLQPKPTSSIKKS